MLTMIALIASITGEQFLGYNKPMFMDAEYNVAGSIIYQEWFISETGQDVRLRVNNVAHHPYFKGYFRQFAHDYVIDTDINSPFKIEGRPLASSLYKERPYDYVLSLKEPTRLVLVDRNMPLAIIVNVRPVFEFLEPKDPENLNQDDIAGPF